jgi:hypothetical protein
VLNIQPVIPINLEGRTKRMREPATALAAGVMLRAAHAWAQVSQDIFVILRLCSPLATSLDRSRRPCEFEEVR